MKLVITEKAQQWFKDEINVQSDMGIRFYGKIYGSTPVHEGMSVGMSVEEPGNPLVKEEIEGLVYFIDETDDWFFKGYDLIVDFDEQENEPKYDFTSNQEDLKGK